MRDFVISIILLMLSSCDYNKSDNNISYDSAYFMSEDSRDYILANNAKWRNGNLFIKDDMKPFKIRDKDLPYIKACMHKILYKNRKVLLPMKLYYRQYIGYKKNNKRYVYINLFSYIKKKNNLVPDLNNIIITENEGNYVFGYMLLDYSSGNIIRCVFKKINESFQ